MNMLIVQPKNIGSSFSKYKKKRADFSGGGLSREIERECVCMVVESIKYTMFISLFNNDNNNNNY